MIIKQTYQTPVDFLDWLVNKLIEEKYISEKLGGIYREAYVNGMDNPICITDEKGDIQLWSYADDILDLLEYKVSKENNKIVVSKEYPAIKYTFFSGKDNTVTLSQALEIIKHTDKPLRYTHGLMFRGPSTCKEPRTSKQILDIIHNNKMVDIHEHDDYIHINTYSGNDMW